MGLAFLGAGVLFLPIFFVIFIRRVQLVPDRPEGLAEIRRKSVIRQSTARYELCEIKRATVQSTCGENGTLYRVALIVASDGVEGDTPLTTACSNTGDPHGVAEAINTWLGI